MRDVGVLRIDGRGVAPIWKSDNTVRDLRVGPDQTLWFSTWSDGTFRAAQGEPEKVGDESYEELGVVGDDDVWAITGSHGQVVHYDGESWKTVRSRSSFEGFYSDNKLLDLAVGGGLVWVAMWNGLWRYDSHSWQRIDAPQGAKPHAFTDNIFAVGKRLVARYGKRNFVYEGDAWRTMPWPHPGYALWDVQRTGFVVGWTPDAQRLAFGRLDGSKPPVVGEPLGVGRIHDVSIDTSGRAWVAADLGLRVVDAQGSVVESREPGTIPGVDGELYLVAVAGAGPESVPQRAAQVRDVTGRILIYKSRKPLPNAVVELCPSPSRKRGCAGAAFSRRAKTDNDGRFRIPNVPDGKFRLYVAHPSERPECATPFTLPLMAPVAPAKQCGPAGADAAPCDLPDAYVCMPFEMPPPRP